MNIRTAVKEDIPKIYSLMLNNGLINSDISEKNFTQWIDWYYWKTTDSGIKNYQIVIDDKNEIIAHYGLTPLPYFCKGEGEITGGLSSWLVIDKKHRLNGSVFFKIQSYFLNNYTHQKIDFTFGPTNHPLILSTHLKTGYKKYNQMYIYSRPYKIKSLCKNIDFPPIIKRVIKLFSPLGDHLLRFNYTPSIKSRTIKKCTSFPVEIERFVIHTLYPFHMWATRSQKMMNWRFFEHPIYSYEVFSVYKGKEMRGYVVMDLRKNKEDKTLILVDMLINGNDWKSFLSIWNVIHQKALHENVSQIDFALTPFPSMRKYLIYAGFIDTRERYTIVGHGENLSQADSDIKEKGWYATWLDYHYV